MTTEKRKREPNWLQSEKLLLLDLVEEHFSVVENKRTDSISMKQKLREWETMSSNYNSQTLHCPRTGEKLKAQWENMKKMAKKEEAKIRQNGIKTGGGPPVNKKDDSIHERIIKLIETSATGLFNPSEGDSLFLQTLKDDPLCDYEIDDESREKLQTNFAEGEASEDEVVDSNSQQTKNWDDYTPQTLTSKKSYCPKTNTPKENKNWVFKRQPTHASSKTSLELLRDKKIEAIDIQIKVAYKEMERLQKLAEIDIEIKKEILKQEKIKTIMLLLEKRKKKKEGKVG